MGDLIENLITLVLWIVASYYLRSKRNKAEPQPKPKPKEQGPVLPRSLVEPRETLLRSRRVESPNIPAALMT